MAYNQSYPISGNPVRALEVLRDYFIHNSFELTELNATGFKARLPRKAHGIHQQHNPLSMLREVSIDSMGQTLTVDAKGGGGAKTIALVFGIMLLVCGFVVLAAIMESRNPNAKPFPWQPIAGSMAFVFLLVAAIFGKLHKVSRHLLDVAVANASMVAEFEARGGRR